MDDSAGDGSHGNKRKSVEKLSGASRRKLAKEASLKADASKCLKLTSFLIKLPVVQSVEVPAEYNPVSDYQHPTTSFSTEVTELPQTEPPPASGSQDNKQTDPEVFCLYQ